MELGQGLSAQRELYYHAHASHLYYRYYYYITWDVKSQKYSCCSSSFSLLSFHSFLLTFCFCWFYIPVISARFQCPGNYIKKVPPRTTRDHEAGMSQGISATPHKGMMWLAPRTATFDSLHAGTHQLGGLVAHQKSQAQTWIRTGDIRRGTVSWLLGIIGTTLIRLNRNYTYCQFSYIFQTIAKPRASAYCGICRPASSVIFVGIFYIVDSDCTPI